MKKPAVSFCVALLLLLLTAMPALAQPPTAPVALAPDQIQATQFNANWDTTNKAVQGIDTYYLFVSTDPTFSDISKYVSGFDSVAVGGPWQTVNGITAFATYYYRVRAHNVSGLSPSSNVIAVPIALPTTATGATNITSTGFTANWQPLAGVTGYRLDVAMLKSFGPVVHTVYWDTLVGNVTSFAVSGLIPDTTYFYRVHTVSGAGESNPSNTIAVSRIISASPLATGTISVPYAVKLQFDGDTSPTGWTVTSGALPGGLTLDAGTATIFGTPTATGTFTFGVQCTDGTPAAVSKIFKLSIVSTPTIALDRVGFTQYAYNNGSRIPSLSLTWDHTVGLGSNRMLVVQAGATDSLRDHVFISGVTYNAKPMTIAKQQGNDSTGGQEFINVGMWYMLETDLPSDSLPHAVVVTYANGTTGQAGCSISLNHVKQAAPETVASDSGCQVNHLTTFLTTQSAHAWLINTAVNGYSGAFFLGHNQEVRYQVDNGNFDIIGDTKEVAVASPDSMQANHHIFYRMAQVAMAVAPVPSATANASVKFYLQGPYVTAADTMANGLKHGGQLASHFSTATIPSLAVDSVNIEIRDSLSAAKSLIRAFAPAWLLTNGTIVDFVDTTRSFVAFGGVPAGAYYVVVRHRNHLAVMSSVRVTVTGSLTPTAYDFSTGQGQANGANPLILTGTKYSLIGGNASNADIVINALDRVATRNNLGAITYIDADVTLDGVVNALDRVLSRNNLGQLSQVP